MRLLLLGLVLACAAPTLARAQEPEAPPTVDDEAARQHFESGRVYYQRAQYEDAAREFGEAYRLSHRPALLINLSRAWEGGLRFDLAAQAMQDYLAVAPPDDPDRGSNEERLARLRASAERRAAEQHAQDGAHGPPHGHVTPPPPPSGLTDSQVAGIVTLGGAAAVGLVSLILGLVADGTFHDLEHACPGGLCPPERQSDIDTGNALAVTSTMLTTAALIAVLTGVIFLALGGRHDPPPRAHGPSQAGVRAHFLGTGLSLEWGL